MSDSVLEHRVDLDIGQLRAAVQRDQLNQKHDAFDDPSKLLDEIDCCATFDLGHATSLAIEFFIRERRKEWAHDR